MNTIKKYGTPLKLGQKKKQADRHERVFVYIRLSTSGVSTTTGQEKQKSTFRVRGSPETAVRASVGPMKERGGVVV